MFTNGASLEDCHTNFFALADLCGIKWRRLKFEPHSPSSVSKDPLDDPVLTSYSKCLSAGELLCAWTRTVKQSTMDSLSESTQQSQLMRELWIFWYSGDPDLTEYLSPELTEVEQGSWDGGLSYECRSVLFKAFHNLIERCLLSKGFARFGKWFIQPSPQAAADKRVGSSSDPTAQLSFSFKFFVHGDSTICASVDVRRHPSVSRLTKSHLAAAQSSQNGLKVMLGPYGLSGHLTGQTFKDGDPAVHKMLSDWKRFYPLNPNQKESTPTSRFPNTATPAAGSPAQVTGNLPAVVEVVVAGLKMKYPTSYTFVTIESHEEHRSVATRFTSNKVQIVPEICADVPPKLTTPRLSPRNVNDTSVEFRLRCGAVQDVGTVVVTSKEEQDDQYFWSVVDPTSRVSCLGSRCKSARKGANLAPKTVASKVANKVDKTPKKQPFHKRLAASSSSNDDSANTNAAISGQPKTPSAAPKSPKAGGLASIAASTPGIGDSPRSAAPTSDDPGSVMGLSSVSPFTSVKEQPGSVINSIAPEQSQALKFASEQMFSPKPNNSGQESVTSGNSLVDSMGLQKPILTESSVEQLEPRRSSSLLYDFDAIMPSPTLWDLPVPKRRRTQASFCGLDPNGGNVQLMKPKDPYEFDDENRQGQSVQIEMDVGQVPNVKALLGTPVIDSSQNFLKPDNMFTPYDELDHIFETSSGEDSNDGTMQKPRAPAAPLSVQELTKMFPTPPSLEPNAIPSPSTTALEMTLLSVESPCSPAALESLRSATFVYKATVACVHPSPPKYSLVDLPTLPPLPSECIYKRPDKNANSLDAPRNAIERHQSPKGYRLISGQMQTHFAGHMPRPPMRSAVRCNISSHGTSYPKSQSPFAARLPMTPASLPASGEETFRLRSIADGSQTNGVDMEVNSVLLNLAISDSLLNLHKDHNFESCTVCVCNNNIKGADAGIFLPDALVPGIEEPQYKCTCGFSAVVNRSRSQFAGLFFEDEVDITGIFYDPCDGKSKTALMLDVKRDDKNTPDIIDLLVEFLRHQSTFMLPSSSILAKSEWHVSHQLPEMRSVYKTDACHIAYLTLKSGKSVLDCYQKFNFEALEHRISKHTLDEWQFQAAEIPENNQDVVRFLRSLQPVFQESVQKKPKASAMWEVTYSVSGPLTWRQFHRLAGRGTEDQCEPQPIPSLLVGQSKNWSVTSPFALKHWDKLLLEPYSRTRNVSYLVLAPDSPHLFPQIRSYFRELTCMYETLRLGRHSSISEIVREGIIRVGKNYATKVANETVDDWFDQIPSCSVASRLKTYAQVCKSYLVNVILKHASEKKADSANNPPRPSVGSPASSDASQGDKNDDFGSGDASHSVPVHPLTSEDGEEERKPAIVVYLVEPFSFSSLDEETYRMACIGLLRCFSLIYRALPDVQHSLNLQVVSLESILNIGTDKKGSSRQDQLRSLAFAVFQQCRRCLSPVPLSKSLTGFGPAASLDHFLKKNAETGSNGIHSRMFYSAPFVLAPLKDKNTELGEMFGDGKEKSQTLFCCYCLTKDQKWIVASCSNDRGDILENSLIKIEVANRTRRKRASVKKFGLNKVMEFIISVMSEALEPWRLVVGRLGRVGHGELKEWASLLSKRALVKATARLKEKCEQCRTLSHFEQPSILSACLISLEADSCLRVFPDQFTSEDKFTSATCPLNTPQDASSTHLLIFPTSATTQSQGNFQNDPPNLGEDDLLSALGADGDDLGVDDGMGDLFNWNDDPPSPGLGLGSPRQHGMSHPDSPGSRHMGFDGMGSLKGAIGLNDLSDEPLQLLQQPLALGYYVSTARPGPLPEWFWSSCEHLKDVNPAFLRSALLIHTPSVHQHNDDFLHSNNRNSHPLDSNLTTDVLRYVLEGYNSLSWLVLDPATHDRNSCLPIHIQALVQLYNTVQALT